MKALILFTAVCVSFMGMCQEYGTLEVEESFAVDVYGNSKPHVILNTGELIYYDKVNMDIVFDVITCYRGSSKTEYVFHVLTSALVGNSDESIAQAKQYMFTTAKRADRSPADVIFANDSVQLALVPITSSTNSSTGVTGLSVYGSVPGIFYNNEFYALAGNSSKQDALISEYFPDGSVVKETLLGIKRSTRRKLYKELRETYLREHIVKL